MTPVTVKARILPDYGQILSQLGRAILGISLGNKSMESGKYLRTACDWTFSNIGEYDLLVGDYLNRYNYQAFDGDNEYVAAEKARLLGREVFSNLESLIRIQKISGNPKILSTYSPYKDQYFFERREFFFSKYATNREFKKYVDEGIENFLVRKHPNLILNDKVRNLCAAYQIEELAIFEKLSKEGYHVLVYHGAQLPIMKAFVEKRLLGISKDIEDLVLVELKIF